MSREPKHVPHFVSQFDVQGETTGFATGSQSPNFVDGHVSHLKLVFLKYRAGQEVLHVFDVGWRKKYVEALVLVQAVQLVAVTSHVAQPAWQGRHVKVF